MQIYQISVLKSFHQLYTSNNEACHKLFTHENKYRNWFPWISVLKSFPKLNTAWIMKLVTSFLRMKV